jgi:hypothetical protein
MSALTAVFKYIDENQDRYITVREHYILVSRMGSEKF